MTVKHNGDEAFLFYFPVSTQTQQESGFIVFLQYDTSSRFKLILSPSVCDFSVADFSDRSVIFSCQGPKGKLHRPKGGNPSISDISRS